MAIFRKFAKILPFFVLKKLNECAPRGPVVLTFMNIRTGGDDWDDEPTHPTAKVDIFHFFDGVYLFSDERFNLEMQEKKLEKKLACVKNKLGK